jgi:hypothetical protein
MKNLFKASLILFLFSMSISVFQLSCSKEAEAQSSPSSDLIIFLKKDGIYSSDGTGNNQKKLSIIFPEGYSLLLQSLGNQFRLSSDKKTIYLAASKSNQSASLFSCSVNGGNATKIIDDFYFVFDVK